MTLIYKKENYILSISFPINSFSDELEKNAKFRDSILIKINDERINSFLAYPLEVLQSAEILNNRQKYIFAKRLQNHDIEYHFQLD